MLHDATSVLWFYEFYDDDFNKNVTMDKTWTGLWDTGTTFSFMYVDTFILQRKRPCVFQALCALFTLPEAWVTYLNEIFMP